MMSRRVWMVCLCVVTSWSLVYAQGYRIEPDRIVVEGDDWKAWDHPKGVLQFDEEDGLHPRFVHRNINACLDADGFTYGVGPGSTEPIRGGPRDAGSKPKDVANVMDGDLSTFWEPNIADPLEDWWFVMDLGRLVSATKIVLKFVEEGKGDPFLQFKVGVSSGYKWGAKPSGAMGFFPDKPLFYRTIGSTTQPNERQRVFEFEVSWAGLPAIGEIQFVRVVVTDTRGDQREQISREEYERLDMDWRGSIEYYRITAAGREEVTDREGYERLSPEQKGSIKYYRRERPGLAELEVWTVGENLSLGVGDRGGSVEVFGGGSEAGTRAVDGNVNTWTRLMAYRGVELPAGVLVDLGGVFWVDAVYLLFERASAGYRLRTSDGSVGMEGELAWTQDAERRLPAKLDRVMFPVQKIRYVDFRSMFDPRGMTSGYTTIFGLTEIKVYGEGYVPDVILTSKPIEVGSYRHLTSMQWMSDVPPGTSVEIQTRTGDTLGEEKHYFDVSGNEVTEFYWRHRLPGFMKGPVKIKPIPGPGWSPWSRPYERSNDPFQSPSPRKYLQIRVNLLSDDPYQAPSLKSLSIAFTTPLTETISGTMSPHQVHRLGALERFTLQLHPLLQTWHPGFNQLLLQTLDRMEMKLMKMEMKGDSTFTDLTDQVEILPTQSDSLWMVLPDTIQAGEAQELEVQFQSALYQDSTPFNVFVGNSSLPGVWQQVESEDFHPFLNTFIVFVPLDKKMIDNVEIAPSVLTPNGDGVNEVMTIHFTVGRIKAPRDVQVTIYDLRGRSVRHMVERREKYPLGKYAMEWDGKDDRGRLVAPGMYVVVLRVHSNWEEARNTEVKRRVVVVY